MGGLFAESLKEVRAELLGSFPNQVYGLGFGHVIRCSLDIAGVETHPGRSHRCEAVNPPHDPLRSSSLGFSSKSLMGIPAGPNQHRLVTRAAFNRGPGMTCCTSRFWLSGTMKAKARIVSGRDDAAKLLPTLRGAAALSMAMGQCMLTFCEAVFLVVNICAFAT